jgi:hypothetical protein
VDADPGVEDDSCGTECADDDGDGNLIDVVVLDSPSDLYNGTSLFTNNAGLGADMFQAFLCGSGPYCDGLDDGPYTVRVLASDKTSPQNNVATVDYSFVLDTSAPVIAFSGIIGLNVSNAPSVQFILDAGVVDRHSDGTAVTSATVQVTLDGGDGVCGSSNDTTDPAAVGVTPNPVDVTSQVNTNRGDFQATFTATKLAAGNYTYCFEIVADDGAKRKDGFDDDLSVSAVASKDFNWQ